MHCKKMYTDGCVCVFAVISCRKPDILARVAELRLEKFGDKMADIDATQVCAVG